MPQAAPMPRRMRARVGSIMMLGARIEHLVTMALIKELGLDLFKGLLATQKLGLASKLSKLQYIVEAQKEEDFAEAYDELSVLTDKFLMVRNILAHACFTHRIWKNPGGYDYFFQDINDIGTEEDLFSTKFAMYNEDELQEAINTGFYVCQKLCELFAVGMLPGLSPGTTRDSKPPTPRSLRKKGGAKSKPSFDSI